MQSKTLKKIIILLAAFLLLASAVFLKTVAGTRSSGAAEETKTQRENREFFDKPQFTATKGDYVQVAENTGYRLYMRESDLSVIVEDKNSGATMESAITYDDEQSNATWLAAMQSALVLTIINNNDDTKQADLINDNVTVNISYAKDGFKAEVFWTVYRFGLTMEVQFNDDGFTSWIEDSTIEEKGDSYSIGSISMYPYMGQSYLDTKEGYMLIPDGNGALIYLNDKEGRYITGYSETIYGTDIGFKDSQVISLLWDKYNMVTDGEQIIAPIFGIAHTDDQIAFLGIVEDGATRASIEAHPNGASVNYNRAYARFIERRLYTQPTSNNSTSGSLHLMESDRSHSDLQVRYLFLSGDQANYAGMANAYRSYLIKNGELSEIGDSYKTRIDFLGTERESWIIGTSTVTMTTVDDIRDIYADLKESGINDIFTVYKGWQKGGLYSLPISKYKADKDIGGTGDLTKLIKDAKNEGKSFYLYNNALLLNPDEASASFNVISQINKRRYSVNTYKDVYESLMYLAPLRSESNINSFIKSYTKKGVDGVALAGVSNNIFSYYYRGGTYSRHSSAASMEKMVDAANEKTDLVLEQPFAYLWHDTSAFLDMPMYTSGFIFEDESVPFLSIVLKGVMPVYADYMNFEANKQEFFLKMIETGSYPSFYITKESSSDLIYTNSSDIYSSEYSIYRDTIIEYTNSISALLLKVKDAHIITHEMTGNGVTVVGYDNGVKVYVNYSSTEQTADGVNIAAMSYEVTE